MQTHGRQTAGSPHILTSSGVLRAFQGSPQRVTVCAQAGERAPALQSPRYKSPRICEIVCRHRLKTALVTQTRPLRLTNRAATWQVDINPFPLSKAHLMIIYAGLIRAGVFFSTKPLENSF
jgi:hypothetical protein